MGNNFKKSVIMPLLFSVLATCIFTDRVWSDEFEDACGEIVQDFERHIGSVKGDKKYYVVVRSFIDAETHKPKKICGEIENSIVDKVIERFRSNKNIVVLERSRIEALEKEVAFETDRTHFEDGGWQAKLGKKLGAGFLITGSVVKLSKYLKIRAKMIDIVTGEVLASSTNKVRLDEIDEALISDFGSQKEKKSKPSSSPKNKSATKSSDANHEQPRAAPYNASPTPATTPQLGNYCCDQFGNRRCQLVQPMPIGSSCFCFGQGYGYVCP